MAVTIAVMPCQFMLVHQISGCYPIHGILQVGDDAGEATEKLEGRLHKGDGVVIEGPARNEEPVRLERRR